MLDHAMRILKDVFGYDAFRGNQAAIIERVAGGGDALVLMPTGGGKSLCFQVPALMREGLAVVVSPLIALMDDQVATLDELGVAAVALNSTLSPDEQREIADRIRRGQIKMLYLAPERLVQPRMLSFLQGLDIALFAIDEAHCVSQWGHDFRSAYRELSVVRASLPADIPIMALTATATLPVQEDIVSSLNLRNCVVCRTSFLRQNLVLQCQPRRASPEDDFKPLLMRRPTEGRATYAFDGPTIVYCPTRARVEDIARMLTGLGVTCLPYHAGLPSADRDTAHKRFLRDEIQCVVATVAFGMGINKVSSSNPCAAPALSIEPRFHSPVSSCPSLVLAPSTPSIP